MHNFLFHFFPSSLNENERKRFEIKEEVGKIMERQRVKKKENEKKNIGSQATLIYVYNSISFGLL